MSLPWFKFYGSEYLSDPKILSLSATERSCWITLLSLAGMSEPEGFVRYMTEQRLMMLAGVDFTREEWNETVGIFNRLEKLKMIKIDNDVITIINWHKRQNSQLTGYERVKRWREKHKDDNANDNVRITVDKIRKDKIRVKEIKNKESYKPVKTETLNQLRQKVKELTNKKMIK